MFGTVIHVLFVFVQSFGGSSEGGSFSSYFHWTRLMLMGHGRFLGELGMYSFVSSSKNRMDESSS